MKINIVNSRVIQLSFEKEFQSGESEEVEVIEKGKANFSVEVEFETDIFFVIFHLSLKTAEDMVLKVVFSSEFKTDSVIDSAFKRGDFPYVNAPAIAYPFLRAFVSNLTLNAGHSPVVLPAVNFVALKDEIKNGISSARE